MRFLLLTAFLTIIFSQIVCARQSPPVTAGSPVVVVSAKWSKFRQRVEKKDNQPSVTPQAAMIPVNKNFERTRRINDQVGTIDPNTQTIDGRSAQMQKNVDEARSPKSADVDGFLYQLKIRDAGKSAIEILYWEYQFTEKANPANVSSRQFLCGISVKPNKEKEFSVFTTASPSDVVSAISINDNSADLFDEKILINRVEFADGTYWQRNAWNFSAVKSSIKRALETPWGGETCRKL